MTDIWESNWVHDVTTSASCSVSRDKVSQLLNKTSAVLSHAVALPTVRSATRIRRCWNLRSNERTSCSKCDTFLSRVPTCGRWTGRTGMSHRSLRACRSHGTNTSRISFHPLQHKQNKRKWSDCPEQQIVYFCWRQCLYLPSYTHLLASLSWSACGSSISCGPRFSLWTHFTLKKKKKNQPNSQKRQVQKYLNLSSGKSILCYLYLFIVSLSVQACLENPSHPVEREEQMGCSAGKCTAWTVASQLINFPTLSPFAPLSPRSPREPWRANESVLHHI